MSGGNLSDDGIVALSKLAGWVYVNSLGHFCNCWHEVYSRVHLYPDPALVTSSG